MYSNQFLSFPSDWDSTVQYKKTSISGSIPVGLYLVSVPTVIFDGVLYIAIIDTPEKGISPDTIGSGWEPVATGGGTGGGVQSIIAGTGAKVTGSSANPTVGVDVGTAEGQIPILGEPIKGNIGTLSNQIYGGQLAMTDPQAPHDEKSIDSVAAELLALINTAKVTSFNGDSGPIVLQDGANITITRTSAGNFTIASTGGGSAGVTELNGLAGALEIFEGYGINVDATSQPGKIILSVPNNNLAATYVDAVLDLNAQSLSFTYNNGIAGVGATLTASANGALPAVDGVFPTLGMRLAIINSSNAAYNGIYIITGLGSSSTPWILTRAGDFNTIDTMPEGTAFTVKQGNDYGNGQIVFSGLSGTPPVIGTSLIIFNFTPALRKIGELIGAKFDPKYLNDFAEDADSYSNTVNTDKIMNQDQVINQNFYQKGVNGQWLAGQERPIATFFPNAGGTLSVMFYNQLMSRFGFVAKFGWLNIVLGSFSFNIDANDFSTDGVIYDNLQEFLDNFTFKIYGFVENAGAYGVVTMTPLNTLPVGAGDNVQFYVSMNAGTSLYNQYTPYIGGLFSDLIADFPVYPGIIFVPGSAPLPSNITLPGIAFLQELEGDFVLPNPLPTFSVIAPDVAGRQVLLPMMNIDPPPLGKGQTFTVLNAHFSESFDLCYADGTLIQTIEKLGCYSVIVQDVTTSNGEVVAIPEQRAFLSETRGLQTGIVLLEPDDLYDNPAGVHHFLTPSTVIAIENGGTGQTTAQAALNALAGAVTNGGILAGDGTNIVPRPLSALLDLISSTQGSVLFRGASNWQASSPGVAGQFFTSNGPGANPSFQDDPNTVTEFSWTPVDVNGNPLIIAVGRGRIDGKAVILDFYIQYSAVSGGDYAQINGWDPALNPQDVTGVGPVSTTTATISPNGFPNQVTLLIDRLAFRCNGVVNVMADVANQYLTGHIEYYLDASSIAAFNKAFAKGKIKALDKEKYVKEVLSFYNSSETFRQAKLSEIKNMLDEDNFMSAKESSESLLTIRERNDLKHRVAILGYENVKAEMFPEAA